MAIWLWGIEKALRIFKVGTEGIRVSKMQYISKGTVLHIHQDQVGCLGHGPCFGRGERQGRLRQERQRQMQQRHR